MAKHKLKLTIEEKNKIKILPSMLKKSLSNLFTYVQDYYFTKYQPIYGGFKLNAEKEKYDKIPRSFKNHNIQMFEMINRIEKSVGNDFLKAVDNRESMPEKMKDFIKKSLPFSEQNYNQAVNLKKDLINADKFIQFMKYRERISGFHPMWEKNIYDTQISCMQMKQIQIDMEKKKVGISWPIFIDSYIRDFEFLIQYIIDPFLEDEESRKNMKYHEKISLFFSENIKFLQKLQKEAIKAYIRSLLAHQIYSYDFFKEKYVFIRFYNENPKINEFSSKEMLNFCVNLSILINSLLMIISNQLQEKQINLKALSSEFWNSFLTLTQNIEIKPFLENHIYFQKIKNFKIFSDLEKKFIKNWNEKSPQHQNHILNIIKESQLMLKLYIGKIKDLPLRFTMNSTSRIIYIVIYSLAMEKFVKPLFHVYNPDVNRRNLKETQFLEFCLQFRDGAYKDFFSNIDPNLRNDIAHRNYIENEEMITKRIFFQLPNKMYEFEKVFNPQLEITTLEGGIGELWYNIFNTPPSKWPKSINHEINSLVKIGGYPVIVATVLSVQTILKNEEDLGQKILIQSLKTINSKISTLSHEELERFWVLVLYFLNKNDIPLSSKIFKFLFTHLKYLPDRANLQACILICKIMSAYSNLNIENVRKNYKKLIELIKNNKELRDSRI